ncbi:hypothetical protein DPEC_G00323830 [Dallia pectoralis]|uniref:Uncharacterized protein n=1 Tax=Dallia pectoralis TaxID=75939 RepID=A0ACC2FAT5_DALPE|nr:hypothetical protein DPEC_G00323830 [Dallia pectoralis]
MPALSKAVGSRLAAYGTCQNSDLSLCRVRSVVAVTAVSLVLTVARVWVVARLRLGLLIMVHQYSKKQTETAYRVALLCYLGTVASHLRKRYHQPGGPALH